MIFQESAPSAYNLDKWESPLEEVKIEEVYYSYRVAGYVLNSHWLKE
jgi:hypothetical protein